MARKALFQQKITVQVTRTEITKHERGGESRRAVPDGTLTGNVTLVIDAEAIIAELGPKALRSKGGRAREIGGLVEVICDKKSKVRKPLTPE